MNILRRLVDDTRHFPVEGNVHESRNVGGPLFAGEVVQQDGRRIFQEGALLSGFTHFGRGVPCCLKA